MDRTWESRHAPTGCGDFLQRELEQAAALDPTAGDGFDNIRASIRRPNMSNPTITDIVQRMKQGTKFRVGRDEYRWEKTKGELIVDEGSSSHAISEGQLRQVVASHPEVFGGSKPTLRDVIDRMKKGERFQYGGGRMFEVFGYDASTKQLYVESVVDGEESRGSCSEQRLAEAIAESPQVFADVRY